MAGPRIAGDAVHIASGPACVQISHFTTDRRHRYVLVVASDGLWEFCTNDLVAEKVGCPCPLRTPDWLPGVAVPRRAAASRAARRLTG